MKQYKTIKELPGIPIGTIGCQYGDMIVFADSKFPLSTHQLRIKHIKEYSDFFEEVKEEEKLFTVSDMRRFYEVHKYNPNMNFQALMLNALHIEID